MTATSPRKGPPIALASLAAVLSACAQQPELLNSERIEQQFGSYGVAILSQNSAVRRTNLYSIESDGPICRTYAVVEFAASESPEIFSLHTEILTGASIGATFASQGWEIRKQTTHIGTIELQDASHPLARLMQLDSPTVLATHVYNLYLADESADIHYATILETHHPQYLDSAQLSEIYGPANDLTGADKLRIYKLVLVDHWD